MADNDKKQLRVIKKRIAELKATIAANKAEMQKLRAERVALLKATSEATTVNPTSE